MSGSMGWIPGLMRWRSSLVNSANAWLILEGLLEGLREAISGRAKAS